MRTREHESTYPSKSTYLMYLTHEMAHSNMNESVRDFSVRNQQGGFGELKATRNIKVGYRSRQAGSTDGWMAP